MNYDREAIRRIIEAPTRNGQYFYSVSMLDPEANYGLAVRLTVDIFKTEADRIRGIEHRIGAAGFEFAKSDDFNSAAIGIAVRQFLLADWLRKTRQED